ncbi:MAG: hypothetical protein FWC04_09925 [Chitinispirillia bacterium]|nr:hypothetical protein [Chitinispirillia bacterium]MCL2242828.1 hypothetical protein [Chitinispirillia bacterium]
MKKSKFWSRMLTAAAVIAVSALLMLITSCTDIAQPPMPDLKPQSPDSAKVVPDMTPRTN